MDKATILHSTLKKRGHLHFGRYPSLYHGLTDPQVALIENYAFLSQIGSFPLLDELWTQSAEVFNDVVPFPMCIQRVDSCMRQSRYRDTFRLIEGLVQADEQISTLQRHEKRILLLIKAYCGIHVHGALRFAVLEATQVASWLSNIEVESRYDFEVHAVEYWLHIMKYAVSNSSYADNIPLTCPTCPVNGPTTETDGSIDEDGIFEWTGLTEHFRRLQKSDKLFAALSLAKIVANLVSKSWLVDCYEQLLTTTASLEDWKSDIFLSIVRLHILIACVRADALPESLPSTSTETGALDAELHRLTDLAGCSLPRLRLELAYVRSTGEGAYHDATVLRDFWTDTFNFALNSKDYAIAVDALTKSAPVIEESAANVALCTKLDEIYDQMGDAPGMLMARCCSYRPQHVEDSLRLLEWFSRFDAEHLLSQTLLTGVLSSEPDDTEWDEPPSRLREEEIKTNVLSSVTIPNSQQAPMLQSSEMISSQEVLQQKTQLDRSKHQQSVLRSFMPWKFTQHKGLSAGHFYDVCVMRTAGVSAPMQNLASRVVEECSTGIRLESLSVLLDAFDITNLVDGGSATETAREMQRQLFSSGQSIDEVHRKLDLVQKWIENGTTSRNPESQELILQLKLQATIHASQIGCEPSECAAVESEFKDYLENIDDSRLKQRYARNRLLLEQQTVDSMFFNGPEPHVLPFIRMSYNDILKRYRDSWLSSDVGKVAALYSRLAEVSLRLRDTQNWLEESRSLMEQSVTLFNTVRSNLIVSNTVQTFELQANIKSSLLGQAICHKRNVSALVALYMDEPTGGPGLGLEQNDKVLIQLWEVVQQGKAQALLDKVRNKELGTLSQDTQQSEDFRTAHQTTLLEDTTEYQDPPLIREWIRRQNELSILRTVSPHSTVAVARARAGVIEVEGQIEGESNLSALFTILKQQNLPLSEFARLIQETGKTVVLVDWFVADMQGIQDVLFALTVRIEGHQKPVLSLHRLGGNIEATSRRWVADYIAGEDLIPMSAAWKDLPLLQSLVSFLTRVSEPEEMLIFCPTSIHAIDRVPLHALSLSAESTGGENVLLCRNRIVYTYSHSVLANALRLQDTASSPNSTRSHLIVNPIANHEMAPPEGMNMDTRGFGTVCTKLSGLLSPTATVLTGKQAIKPSVLANAQGATSLLFVGFVHGSPSSDPLKAHLMLYDQEICPTCLPTGHMDAEHTILSASDIIASLRLAQGSLITLLACDSGVSGATVPDEPLGLVAAMMFAGAGSTISTLWKIDTGVAKRWLEAFVLELRLLRQANKVRMSDSSSKTACEWMDVADLSRKVCLRIRREDPSRIRDWAPYVFHGRWRMRMT